MEEIIFTILLPYFLCDNVNSIILLENTVYYRSWLIFVVGHPQVHCNVMLLKLMNSDSIRVEFLFLLIRYLTYRQYGRINEDGDLKSLNIRVILKYNIIIITRVPTCWACYVLKKVLSTWSFWMLGLQGPLTSDAVLDVPPFEDDASDAT
jgi:hypothetical protein